MKEEVKSEISSLKNFEEYTKKLDVPYYSQFLEVEDYFWNIRSCGGTCIKMCLDYFKDEENKKSFSILEIMNEAFNAGGYHAENGFVHDFAVNYFIKNGLVSHREESFSQKERNKLFVKIINELDKNNPSIVSVIKNTLEQTKFHLIVVVGYKADLENKKITHIVYHESESTDPSRGAYRECDIETFQKSWRGKSIFVAKE